MPGWQKAGPVKVEEEYAQAGRYCAMIESNDQAGNYINKQYITLKPNTVYRLTFRMRTENLAGSAQVYPYDFEGADYGGSSLRCTAHGTTPWTDYAMAFKTGGGGRGRICFRVFKGRGKAWFDNIALTEGGGEHWKVMARRFYERKNTGSRELQEISMKSLIALPLILVGGVHPAVAVAEREAVQLGWQDSLSGWWRQRGITPPFASGGELGVQFEHQ